ncbi:hemerythrin domain-containing protein [Snodgrassella sp. CFCC 13594]|uniref:hemerythrin domain-containing protein n=1 Tax=Snodgrassella sp. CFCC 13594 TaxID=1775559 RepID=UPI00082A30F7|nr:hemerythrin domain-containing protein [Snodgrassella sp. CFCC 13594]
MEDRTFWDPETLTDMPLDKLVVYVLKLHHDYIKKTAPLLQQQLHTLANSHDQKQPKLRQIANLFDQIYGDLALHLHKEENVLFPYIIQLQAAFVGNVGISPPQFGSVRFPVRMMMQEHHVADEQFALLIDWCEPMIALPNTEVLIRETFSLLLEFFHDFCLHSHIEDTILFPRALEVENLLLEPKVDDQTESCRIK